MAIKGLLLSVDVTHFVARINYNSLSLGENVMKEKFYAVTGFIIFFLPINKLNELFPPPELILGSQPGNTESRSSNISTHGLLDIEDGSDKCCLSGPVQEDYTNWFPSTITAVGSEAYPKTQTPVQSRLTLRGFWY